MLEAVKALLRRTIGTIPILVGHNRMMKHQVEDRGVVIGRGCPRRLGRIGRSIEQANQRSEGQTIAIIAPKTEFAKATLHGLSQPSAGVARKALRAKSLQSAIRTATSSWK